MSSQTFFCRRLTEEELPAGAQVVFDAFNDYSDRSGTARIPDPGIVLDRLNEYAHDTGIPGLMYGGFLDDEHEPAGFVMLRKLGIDEEAWEISMLGVTPSRQESGIGHRMVEFALGEILRFKGVLAVCAVTEGNDRALRLFAGQGFESEASGIPVGPDMSVWMLRKDLTNEMAARLAAEEAAADAAKEAEELAGYLISPVITEAFAKDTAKSDHPQRP